MLEVDIRARFGDFALDTRFSAGPGLTAVFGRSGSGKTSLVNLLAGLARPGAGRIVVDGQVLFDSETGVNLPPERRRVGYVFQEGRLFPHISVRGNLTYGRRRVPVAERHQDMDTIVRLLDIAPLLDRRVAALSGGEKQRVAIGRALLASPRILLMDEPLASLDLPRKNEILPFIERLRDDLGLPIIYVSHAIEEVIRLADTLVLMSDGRVAAAGGVEELMSRLDLRPLTGRYEAGSVIAAEVVDQDDRFALTELRFADNRLWVPRLDLAAGAALRVRVRARDVALALERPRDISMLNVFEGTVAEIGESDQPMVEVVVDVGVPLVARVTRRTVHDLDLKPGKPLFALLKAVAVDRHSLGGRGPRRHPGSVDAAT